MNPDNASRLRNEAVLSEFIQSHPDSFAGQCCAEFERESHSPALRALFATALKTTLQVKKGQRASIFWAGLTTESKDRVRMAGLNCLIDQSAQVRGAAASLTAMVFVVDFLSDRRFLDLLTPICGNIGNSDAHVRQSSVQTLGSICELLAQQKVTTLDEHSFEKLVGGIWLGLSHEDTTPTAVKALLDSLGFIASKLDNQQILEFVVQKLLRFLEASKTAETPEHFQTALLCIEKVAKLAYPRLKDLGALLVKALVGCLAIPSASAQLNLTELLISTLRLERKYAQGYFQAYWQELLQGTMGLLFTRLSATPEPTDELVDNLLEVMRGVNRVFCVHSYPVLMKFVQDNWESQNEVQRVSALCALNSLVEPAGPDMIDPLIHSFHWTLNCIKNGLSLRVSLHALDLLEQIIAFKAEVVFADLNFQQLVEDFLTILTTTAPSEPILRLKIGVVKTLVLVVDRSESEPAFLRQVRSSAGRIQSATFRAIDSERSAQFIEWLFSTLFSLVRFVIPLESLGDHFTRLLDLHQRILTSYQGDNRALIYETCLINLWLVLRSLRTSQLRLSLPSVSTQKTLEDLLATLDGLFSKSGHTLPDGVLLMTEILLQFPAEFKPVVRSFYDRYLQSGLTNISMPKLMEASLKSFAELIKTFPELFSDVITAFVDYANHLLHNPDVKQEVRVFLFSFMFDVVVTFPLVVANSIGRWLELAVLALDAVAYLQSTDPDNKDSMQFAFSLRDAVIDFLSLVVFELYKKPEFPSIDVPFESHFVNVQVALAKVAESTPNDATAFATNALYLLADFYTHKQQPNLIDSALTHRLFAMASLRPSAELSKLSLYLVHVGLPK